MSVSAEQIARWGRRLRAAAILAFLVSLVCPVQEVGILGLIHGWEALYLSAVTAVDQSLRLRSDMLAWVHATAPNGIAVVAIVLAFVRRMRRHRWLLFVFWLVALLSAVSIWGNSMIEDGSRSGLLIGYWLWTLSFALAAGSAGCFAFAAEYAGPAVPAAIGDASSMRR